MAERVCLDHGGENITLRDKKGVEKEGERRESEC